MLTVTLKKLPDGRIAVQVRIGHIILIDRAVWLLYNNGEEITITTEITAD